MIKIVWDRGFKSIFNKWKKKHPDLYPVFQKQVLAFQEEPYNTQLKTHNLKGSLKGYSAFSINYTYRVVFKFTSDRSKAILIDIGTHDEVY
jgi:addiction module RelE/StbE family toxin